MDIFNKIKEAVADAEADAEKFYANGNKAAGTRLRGHMQTLKTLAQDVRAEVTEIKNGRTAE